MIRPERRFSGYFAVMVTAALLFLASCEGIFSSFSPDASQGPSMVSIVPVPGRQVYPVGGSFDEERDLTVLALYPDGTTREIPVKEVTITGTEDFDIPGEKTITVTYKGKTASYKVMVGDAGAGGGDSSGDGNGTGIILVWPE